MNGPRDLFPTPDTVFLNLAIMTKCRGGFSISLLPPSPSIDQADLLGANLDLAFSASAHEANPTRTLKLVILVYIRGKAPSGGPIQERFPFLLDIPDFAGPETCDFGKSALIPIPRRGMKENLLPFLEAHGLTGYDVSEPVPPFEPPGEK